MNHASLPPALAEVLDALDGLALDFSGLDPEGVDAFLAKRQELLTRIQNHDASRLDEGQRAVLKERLQHRLEADQRLMTAVADTVKQLESQQKSLAQGRAAVRGYAPPEKRIGPAWRRQA